MFACSTSGAGFLSFERDDTPACLILDLKMPGLNGLDVQRFVSATIPIIFITERGDVDSTVKAMKGGASDFLTKPVDEALLLAAVERALDQHRIARRDVLPMPISSRAIVCLRARTRGPSTSCEGQAEQTNCGGTGNRRVHGSNTPRQYHAEDERGFIRRLGQTGGTA
jgi:DNA-binding response OmpR family regulator